MKEIEYRAWVPEKEKMFPVLQMNFHGAKTVTLQFNPVVRRNLDDVYCMQWTGRRDKNGTKIYEDDLLAITNKYVYLSSRVTKRVVWHNHSGRWAGIPTTHECEVIGNFYANPELL